jgi:hypothetical protein
MSKKPSRRKKGRPAKKRPVTFTIVIDAQEMFVEYQPDYFPDSGHFAFRSPHEPRRRIPISETGYRSHFFPMAEVEAAASPQEFARDVALALLRPENWPDGDEAGQLRLF